MPPIDQHPTKGDTENGDTKPKQFGRLFEEFWWCAFKTALRDIISARAQRDLGHKAARAPRAHAQTFRLAISRLPMCVVGREALIEWCAPG